jgi:NAD(P)-dependent dehydrogenase (short-subunit alcohol dehydrogenase family)
VTAASAAGTHLLAGRVVLVSGVGPGLGRSLAVRSALAGADVVLAARTESTLRAVADEVAGLGRKALVVPTDVADVASLTELADQALAAYGRVDALLSSAFVHPPQEELLGTDLDAMHGWYDVNVLAGVRLVQKLAPALIASRGAVVMVNSMVIRNRLPLFGAYRMTKASLLAAARSLSVELGPKGVRVNTVAPGYIWADRVQGYFQRIAKSRGVSAQQVYDEAVATVDLRRLPEPDEIADAAVFLASDMATAITGQCLDVNCGETHH